LLGYVASFVEGLRVMACSSNPNVNSNINNPLPMCVSYYNNPNVDNLQPLHEGGGWEIQLLLLLMNRLLLQCTWKACENKEQHGSHTIVIHPVGFFSR
jgi:hypothetical protein